MGARINPIYLQCRIAQDGFRHVWHTNVQFRRAPASSTLAILMNKFIHSSRNIIRPLQSLWVQLKTCALWIAWDVASDGINPTEQVNENEIQEKGDWY